MAAVRSPLGNWPELGDVLFTDIMQELSLKIKDSLRVSLQTMARSVAGRSCSKTLGQGRHGHQQCCLCGHPLPGGTKNSTARLRRPSLEFG